VRQADVIGVHVGDHHPQHGQALQMLVEDLLPSAARGVVGDATVHDGPAFAQPSLTIVESIAQQPQVDVVQREGQAHAHPLHAWGHGEGAAQCRQLLAQRIAKFVFLCVGHGCFFALHLRLR
jgi:hypothetical protein